MTMNYQIISIWSSMKTTRLTRVKGTESAIIDPSSDSQLYLDYLPAQTHVVERALWGLSWAAARLHYRLWEPLKRI